MKHHSKALRDTVQETQLLSYCWQTTGRQISRILRLLPTLLLFHNLNDGDSLELSGSHLVKEN